MRDQIVATQERRAGIGVYRDLVEVALIADACVSSYRRPDWRHCLLKLLYMPALDIHILIDRRIHQALTSHVRSIRPELSSKPRHLASGAVRRLSAFASR